MGGQGSGRWPGFTRKTTVERCTTLSLTTLTRAGCLTDGILRYVAVTRSSNWTGKEPDFISIVINTLDAETPKMRFHYSVNGEPVSYEVRLTSWPCNFGGIRWYMVCPLCDENRVLKLHLPPGSRYFACRSCHDLTYESCQQSDKRLSRLRKMEPLALIQAVIRGEFSPLLILKALPDWVWQSRP